MYRIGFLIVICSASAALAAAPAGTGLRADVVPNFSQHIAPIIFNNCTSCHRPDQAGPFTLMNFDDVRKRGRLIARVVEKRYMPPWKAAPSDFVKFDNERRLSDEQIALILRWVEGGMPEGDPAHLPTMPKFADGWFLGEPDMVIKMPEAYEVPAEGPDIFRNFVVPAPVDEPKWVKAVEFKPGSPTVVHHSLFFTDTSGTGRKMDEEDRSATGYRSMGGAGFVGAGGFGGWAVGGQPVPLPDGVARQLLPGTDIILQTHFHLSGKPEREQSSLALYFTDEPPTRRMTSIAMGVTRIDIPPGESNYMVEKTFVTPVDVQAVGIVPHMHYVGKEVQVIAAFPDGRSESLLHIPDWDFSWQEQYRYAEPVHIPAGTEITMKFRYDNSADNPRNPSHPPKRVRFGQQSTDEMAFLWIQVIPYKPTDVISLYTEMARQRAGGVGDLFGDGQLDGGEVIRLIVQRFDADGDGKLSTEERAEAMKELEQLRGLRNRFRNR